MLLFEIPRRIANCFGACLIGHLSWDIEYGFRAFGCWHVSEGLAPARMDLVMPMAIYMQLDECSIVHLMLPFAEIMMVLI